MNAQGMRGKCAEIKKADLRRGDWVFKCNSEGRATHIGYVVDDSLNVIEAKGANPGLPYEFNLKVTLANPNAPKDEDGEPVAAPATAPAAPAAGGAAP